MYCSAAKESTKLDGTVGEQHKRVFVLQAKLAALHTFPLLSHTFFSFLTGKEQMISHVIIAKFLQQGPCLTSKGLSTSKPNDCDCGKLIPEGAAKAALSRVFHQTAAEAHKHQPAGAFHSV